MRELEIRNRQKRFQINKAVLRSIATTCLEDFLEVENYSVAIQVIGENEMARMNEQFLNHTGSTDVITFDYREYDAKMDLEVSGEIFVCADDAVKQAREFRSTWQSEIVRYIAHGFLHLLGYDDLDPKSRKIMKREENKLVKQLETQFAFSKLSRA